MTVGGVVVTGIGVCAANADGSAAESSWFDVRTELGRRGYKYLPTACQYLLVAGRRALDDAGDCLDGTVDEQRGVAVGTNAGVAALHDELDRTIIAEHANELSPLTAPYGAVNVLTSRLSLEHEFKGVSVTLTSPLVAGVEAMQIGAAALAAGRSTVLLAGAMEQRMPGPAERGSEDGAVVLVLESSERAEARGARHYGRFATRTLLLPPRRLGTEAERHRAAALVESAVDGLGGRGVAVYTVLDDSPVSEIVASAVRAVPGVGPVRHAGAPGTGSLAPVLRLVDLLRAGDGDSLLVTAAGSGTVAMARVWQTTATRRIAAATKPTGSAEC
jgi:3-oxoacyl-[acyl-carrier-protein] synthase II